MTTGRINQVTTFTRKPPKERLYLLKHAAAVNRSTEVGIFRAGVRELNIVFDK